MMAFKITFCDFRLLFNLQYPAKLSTDALWDIWINNHSNMQQLLCIEDVNRNFIEVPFGSDKHRQMLHGATRYYTTELDNGMVLFQRVYE